LPPFHQQKPAAEAEAEEVPEQNTEASAAQLEWGPEPEPERVLEPAVAGEEAEGEGEEAAGAEEAEVAATVA
jgi:hypothetical protein